MEKDPRTLALRQCKRPDAGASPLGVPEIERYMAELPGWELRDNAIEKKFSFGNFCQTMAFVNAVAWVANRQDHHPDIEFSYRQCRVRYSTHAVGGLSENDFICAARVEQLLV
ncbi:4a-hydroxytetrahydrobiopterin dehydratase [Geobacter sp. DSM 9736]|uniref:4a-hydroxytetrahydrobiopterin dehydratase n=1 Tax=Geobacter sp. DSM 9736 TaxID=1277350 RepID=UPI000B50B162|nr:4a-hydroxytetrahydrobiopterin dehydratase [Geobacter sp. DSM 9736]SNB47772.1 pterin-4-alpha-carbinolamine dehydratase [Geobacter sp. DSM 9736]